MSIKPPLRLKAGNDSRNWWAVPRSGGYIGGCDTGRAAAAAFLKLLAEHRKLFNGSDPGLLQHVVFDMVGEKGMSKSLRGQIVGFFSELDRYLSYASQFYNTDQFDWETLRAQMMAGLDEAAVLAAWESGLRERARPRRSAAAKKGWRTRRNAQRTQS